MTMYRPMRRNSLIGPWGVGAIVPFPNDESLMIAGLDMWQYNNPQDFLIKDERLEKRIGVKELRWPPDYREKNVDPANFHLTIPAVRFPTWYYCPFCGTMKQTSYYETQPECDEYQWPHGRKCKPGKHHRKMIPERFVVVCPEGHIDDFPVAEWLHHDGPHPYDPEGGCRIRRSTGGASAGLGGVFYECTCGAKKSISGVTKPGALGRIDYKCRGSKPWLGIRRDNESPCECTGEDVRVVLRGATNVWFASTMSSIYIPTDGDQEDQKLIGVVNKYYERLKHTRTDGEFDRTLINMLAVAENVDADKFFEALCEKADLEDGMPEVTENTSEDEYRLSEYKVLIKSSGNEAQEFHSINHSITEYDPLIQDYFKSISLVPKLRETRAFIGFSRLQPSDKSISENKKLLRLGDGNWLPAIETYGEGIFFEFDEEKLTNWANDPRVKKRIQKMSDSYKNSFFGHGILGEVRPEYVLIHTFAHLLINQLSFECGYGSSSIRERIYCEKDSNNLHMSGVLIYTASGDSEGSLGGLVRQGEKGRIEDTVISALKNALWCTSDPVCIQSSGQGTDSCNLAACHNCAILPETCCENGNRLLDRGIVIGTLTDTEMGFFSNVRELE